MEDLSESEARETLRTLADRKSLREIARVVGVSHTTLYDFLGGASWSGRTQRLLTDWLRMQDEENVSGGDELDVFLEYADRVVRFAKGGAMSEEKRAVAFDVLQGLEEMARMDGNKPLLERMAAKRRELGPPPPPRAKPTPEPAAEPEAPSLEKLEWLPTLLGKIVADPNYTASEKRALMAEVNAAGMRFWAVSAEWASGQRGMAMQEAEVSSGKRAEANKEAERTASARTAALRQRPEPGFVLSELTDEEAEALEIFLEDQRRNRGEGGPPTAPPPAPEGDRPRPRPS